MSKGLGFKMSATPPPPFFLSFYALYRLREGERKREREAQCGGMVDPLYGRSAVEWKSTTRRPKAYYRH